MANLEASFRELVLQGPDVYTAFESRFFWNHIPEIDGGVTYPLIRATTVSDNAGDTHTTTWGGTALVQLDIYDTDKARCNTSADAVRDWLHRYNSTMDGYSVTIKVRNAPSDYEAEAKLFRRMLEVSILYMTE